MTEKNNAARKMQIKQIKAMAEWLIEEAENIVGDGEKVKPITIVAGVPMCGKARIEVHKGLEYTRSFDEWSSFQEYTEWDDYKYGIG